MEKDLEIDPYKGISNFFGFGIADNTQKILLFWFEAAFSKGSLWDDDPDSLVFEHDRILKLIDAAYILYRKKYSSTKELLTEYSHYSLSDNPITCLRRIVSKLYDLNEFPFLLNRNEWEDPYHVFKDFFEFLPIQEWKVELKLWLQAGLTNDSICSLTKTERLLPFCLHLQKLVQAACFIEIMELDRGNASGIEEKFAEYRREDEGNRERYQKRERPINFVSRTPYVSIQEVFQDFHLDDIRMELNLWLQLALSNDQSAYAEGYEREDLMEFCEELQILLEGVHLLNQNTKQKNTAELNDKLPDKLKEELKEYNQPELLTSEQIKNPISVIKSFCYKFTLTYVRSELWDLLDAVITFEGQKEVNRTCLLECHLSILALTEAAYEINRRE